MCLLDSISWRIQPGNGSELLPKKKTLIWDLGAKSFTSQLEIKTPSQQRVKNRELLAQSSSASFTCDKLRWFNWQECTNCEMFKSLGNCERNNNIKYSGTAKRDCFEKREQKTESDFWQLMLTVWKPEVSSILYKKVLISYSGRMEKTENQIPILNCKNVWDQKKFTWFNNQTGTLGDDAEKLVGTSARNMEKLEPTLTMVEKKWLPQMCQFPELVIYRLYGNTKLRL